MHDCVKRSDATLGQLDVRDHRHSESDERKNEHSSNPVHGRRTLALAAGAPPVGKLIARTTSRATAPATMSNAGSSDRGADDGGIKELEPKSEPKRE